MKLRCSMCNAVLDNKQHYLYGNHRICSHRCYRAIEDEASGKQMVLDLEDDSQDYIDLVKRQQEKHNAIRDHLSTP